MLEPRFDREWGEAARYPQFKKLGKEEWIKLAKKGKAVSIITVDDISSTDASNPDKFQKLDKNKQTRALAQLKSGNVEMPIIAIYSDGYKELIAGNTRLTGMMALEGKATVWEFEVPGKREQKLLDPLVINIDVCGICNESCNYCPRSHGYDNRKEYMSLEMFKDFIETVNDWGYTGFICWSGRGENSLHPDHSAMIKILHHKHRMYKTRILTNGYKWEKKKELLEMFDVMILNTYSTKEETARRKEAFPWADVRFWDQSVEPDEWEVTPIQIQNRNELFMGLKQETVPLPCALPISRGWIHHDGSIQLCSNDWTDTNIFGNIKEDNFFDVWHNNPVLKQMKIDLAKGERTKYKVCSSCNRKPTVKDLTRIKRRLYGQR